MEELCRPNVYNYADYTSVACYGDNMVDVYQRLQHVISVMLKWCRLPSKPGKVPIHSISE